MSIPTRKAGAPPLECSRLTLDGHCGLPAKWHIIWNEAIDNGLACDEHMDEIRQKWTYLAVHEYEMACSIWGAKFHSLLNRCIVEDGDLGISESRVFEVSR